MPGTSFRFIDVHDAAQRLGISRLQLLEWVEQGRIKPFSGKGQQSIFRAADVERLAGEMQVEAAAKQADDAARAEAEAGAQSAVKATGRVRRRDPIKLIGTRLSMDSRWAEITGDDIATWLDATEPVQYDRVRKVANSAIEKLRQVVDAIDSAERTR